MKEYFIKWLKTFHPPLLLSVICTIVFSGFAICYVATDWFASFPIIISYIIYVCAAAFLFLAICATIQFFMKTSPKQQFLEVAGKNVFTAKLTQDITFRTMTASTTSLVFNVILSASKLFAGWYFYSTWLMVLAGYYLILCLSKALLLNYGRKQAKITTKTSVIIHEWKAYRLCGIMLLIMAAFLQGVVIMIVKNGTGFSYNEIVVIAIATYDFYCLINAIFYMINKRKNHSPIVNSLKMISFASTLVAMLSLQTAMFSSFGSETDTYFKPIMNILTGTFVCVFLIALGIASIIKSNKELKQAATYSES